MKTAKIEEPAGKSAPLKDLGAGKTGDNGPTKEDFLFFVGQFDEAERQKKAAAKFRKMVREQAALRGLQLDAMDKAVAERDREESTTVENLKDFRTYCQWLDLPTGWQFDFFDGKGSPAEKESLTQQAYNDGYELGVLGKQPDDEQKYPAPLQGGDAALHDSHIEGWKKGKKINTDKFEKMMTEANAAEAAKKKAKEQRAAAKRAKEEGAAKAAEPEAVY